MAHDLERLAILEDRALERGHPWLSRGGRKRDAACNTAFHLELPFLLEFDFRTTLPTLYLATMSA